MTQRFEYVKVDFYSEFTLLLSIDIDECQEGLHDCAEDIEVCVNLVGTYQCYCSIGFERHEAISQCIG